MTPLGTLKISKIWIVSVAEQAGLSPTCMETPKAFFSDITLWPIYSKLFFGRLKNSPEQRPPLPSNSPLVLAKEAVATQIPTAPGNQPFVHQWTFP